MPGYSGNGELCQGIILIISSIINNLISSFKDIDECSVNETICGTGFTCTNFDGGYNCTGMFSFFYFFILLILLFLRYQWMYFES